MDETKEKFVKNSKGTGSRRCTGRLGGDGEMRETGIRLFKMELDSVFHLMVVLLY